jgi:two-component system CheB/CheR fusion protein
MPRKQQKKPVVSKAASGKGAPRAASARNLTGKSAESLRPANPPAPARIPAFGIVGIGASAGGLEALGQLLSALPADPKLAIVIVQHLAPKHESVLPHLLSDSSALPVTEVSDEMIVEPNHVYVVPPNKEMGISNGRLQLMPRPSNRTQYNPIDFFLRTLAEYGQTRAIGVILSGTASDGAIGLRDIKSSGGIVICQDPKTAKFDGMPRAAISTGVVDLVLPPAEIARELARIGRHLDTAPSPQPGDAAAGFAISGAAPDSAQLVRIFALLRKATGVDFTHYKLPTLRRRLNRRMVLHKVATMEQYVRLLEKIPTEVTALYRDILIHVTRFFREPDSFDALKEFVFPNAVEGAKHGNPIRVWVPGCATGEEAYSIAISLLEYLGDESSPTPIQIFGTDLSEEAIDQARLGIYPESIAVDVAPDLLRRYFNPIDGHYRINKSVRDHCVFARQDVTRDPPFSKLDLIVCRNVLIYLDAILQKKLMQVFHYALRPKGFLMLGSAETVGTHTDLFAVTDKKYKVYVKKVISAARREMEFASRNQGPSRDHSQAAAAPDMVRSAGNVQQEANRIILSRYSPPGVIVDSDLKITQFRGQTGDYLEPAPGEASLNLLKMAREGLLYGLRTAIHEAKKKDGVVRKEGLRIKVGGRVRDIAVEIIPLAAPEGRHYLILFHDRTAVPSASFSNAPPPPPPAKSRQGRKSEKSPGDEAGANARLRQAQQELAASREYLQSIIQDMEAANEELQSANEEILSSNEELQSTNEELDTAKEELQSTNEELNTVNEELQGRNEELSRVNSDLVNLLASVQIAIVIVASDLRIRRFTPMAEKVLNLIPTDLGRPISDIKPNIDCPDLERLIIDAIDSVTIKEREAKDRHGNWYMLRIRPYKNLENRIDGAVITLFDIDSSRRQVAERAVVPEAVGALTEASSEPMLILDSRQMVRAANRAFLRDMKLENIIGRPIFEIGNGQWSAEEMRRMMEALSSDGKSGKLDKDISEPGDGRLSIHARRQSIGGEMMTLVVFNRNGCGGD